jgi:small-conductance mechanosensitive channel
MGAKSDVMIEVFNALKENNIEIPFPQREVKITG